MRKGTLLVLGLITIVLGGNTCAREPLSRAGDRADGVREDSPPDEQRVPIYDGGLRGKWQDWGWAPRSLEEEQPAKLNLANHGGWILKAKEPPSGASGLAFRFKAPPEAGDFLEVGLGDAEEKVFPKVAVTPSHRRTLDDGWEEVVLSMNELNPHALPFDRVVLRANRRTSKEWVLVDELALIMGTGDGDPTSARASNGVMLQGPVKDARFTVTCDAKGARIDERIYGIAFSPRTMKDDAHQWSLGASARRWGGNPTERFNWKIGNAWNTVSDWYFQNLNYTGDDAWTWKDFLDENRDKGVQTALTVPVLGWVAKDHASYSFPVKSFGAQQQVDPSNSDAGNGKTLDGKNIEPGPPSRTSIEVGPDYVSSWIKEIRKADQDRGARSVHTYILGNEPMLWSTTHRDVHPSHVTYDELLQRTLDYGTAVREADPDARIAGPALWGWPAYFYSAADAAVGFRLRPDRRRHGDVPLLEWYLRELKKHEKKTGVKILDAVDVHFYPQSEVHNDRTDPDTASRRIRSTRALWDPRYQDESWIGEPIRLIPRMQDIIASNYPGLDLVIGEYNFGGEKHMSGALALAEALGRFGQLGVDEAYYWTAPPSGSPAFWAFRAYRDYDRSGARFERVSVPAQAPNGTSLFASQSEDGKKLVAVALNFSPDEALDADVRLQGCEDTASVRVFSLSEQKHGLVPGTSAFRGERVRAILPPYSVNVIEVTLAPEKERQAKAEPEASDP